MKTILVKELKKRIVGNIFYCGEISCSDCIFFMNSLECGGYEEDMD